MRGTKLPLSRRCFLALAGAGAGALALGPLKLGSFIPRGKRPPSKILGADASLGHRLRGGKLPAVSEHLKKSVVIVGGGVAGLSAAWRLGKRGFEDFALLELESELGGNSRGGANAVSAYPWGAHYLPIPSEESTLARELLTEMGILKGYNGKGLPVFDETALCGDPQERLFIHGRWQEGVIPSRGLSLAEQQETSRFLAEVDAMKGKRGQDGKKIFAIPIDESSADPTWRALDDMTFGSWLGVRGYRSTSLRWYIEYCMRDDYGTATEGVSAWAGLHYFASRDAHAAGAEPSAVLTWPEGNQRLVRGLASGFAREARTSLAVTRVGTRKGGAYVEALNPRRETSVRIDCDAVIFAAPRFVARRAIPELGTSFGEMTYAPWMVANLTVRKLPEEHESEAPLSWDNVIYRGKGLGYIHAGHQSIRSHSGPSVLTYYLPLSSEDPKAAREHALATSPEAWSEQVFADLSRAHPSLERLTERVDLWLWGHGMIRPLPGIIWGKSREERMKSLGPIHFAHSDMSGISIFEEAQLRGVQAADRVLEQLGLARRIS